MKTMWNPLLIAELPKPLSCRLLAPMLTKYAEAESATTPAEQSAVRAHLSACAACRTEIAAVRAVGTLLRKRGAAALPTPVPATDLWARIETRIIADDAKTAWRGASLRPALLFVPALAAIAAAIVFLPQTAQKPDAVNKPFATATATAPLAEIAGAPLVAEQSHFAANTAETARRAAPPVAVRLAAKATPRPVAVVPRRLAYKKPLACIPMPAVATAPRRHKPDYVLVTVVPVARPSVPRLPVQVARAAPKPMVDTLPIPARPVVAVFAAAPKPRLASPASVAADNTIRIVKSDPGTGVPDTDTASPVTDTLIRSRQKRGLFGGYGATVATLPTGGDGSPW